MESRHILREFGRSIFQDVLFACRMFINNKAVTAVAMLSLVLAMGVNTTVFMLYNALALRPLPVESPENIVRVYQSIGDLSRAFSEKQYEYYRDKNQVFSEVAAFSSGSSHWAIGANDNSTATRSIAGQFVSANYFTLFGTKPLLGRLLVHEDDRLSSDPAIVVLSENFWQRALAADPNIVGRTLLMNDKVFTIVGIAPASFSGLSPASPDFWVPLRAQLLITGNDDFSDPGSYWLEMIARLRPVVSLNQAEAAMVVLARQSALENGNAKVTVEVKPGGFLSPEQRSSILPGVTMVGIAVTFVLLIACANLACLLLSRAVVRHKEVAIRLALGARRIRLIRQMLTESFVLALASGMFSVLIAWWVAHAVLGLIAPPSGGTLTLVLTPDHRLLIYTVVLSSAASICFGLAPALQATRSETSSSLISNDETLGLRFKRSRVRDTFVVLEITACVVLLVASGLLVRSSQRARSTDPGFETKQVICVPLELQARGYDEGRATVLERELQEQLRSQTDIKSVSFAYSIPLGARLNSAPVTLPGRSLLPQGEQVFVPFNVISPAFFETLEIPILRGRAFSEADTAAARQVVIVNEAAARRFWPGKDAISERIQVGPTDCIVIGVAKDTRSVHLWGSREPQVYRPLAQMPHFTLLASLFIRTQEQPDRVMSLLPQIVRGLDKHLRIRMGLLEANIEPWIWPSRIAATVSGVIGLLGVLLAAIGINGVVGYTVKQKSHEIGIRMAMGAQRSDILGWLLSQISVLVGLGVVLGIGGSLVLSRLLARFLFGLSPADPVTYLSVSCLVIAVALIAAFIPAREATRQDPAFVLRHT